ncbi:hypothetical protein LTR64_008271 [Lithohypha guttulata]|uniref:uncharacterized protein n=1 Tax=Lithohypha guttulata TaxID=1690604 RepID=UPI002DDE8AB2|nr:hypothetical protein LTR51_008423 [Lithohypha guttulata]
MSRPNLLRDNLGTIEKLRDALDAVLEQWCALIDVTREPDNDDSLVIHTWDAELGQLQAEADNVLETGDNSFDSDEMRRTMVNIMTLVGGMRTLLKHVYDQGEKRVNDPLLACDRKDVATLARGMREEELATTITMWQSALDESHKKPSLTYMDEEAETIKQGDRIEMLDDVYNKRFGMSLRTSLQSSSGNRNRHDDLDFEQSIMAPDEDNADVEGFQGEEDPAESGNDNESPSYDHGNCKIAEYETHNNEQQDSHDELLPPQEERHTQPTTNTSASSTIEDLSTSMNEVTLTRSPDQIPPTPDLTPDHSPIPAEPSMDNSVGHANTTALALAPNPAAQGANQFLQLTQEDTDPYASNTWPDRAGNAGGNSARGGAGRGKTRRKVRG